MTKVYLHSIASHGSWYFYQSLECAVRLIANVAEVDSVELVFHPVNPSSIPLFLRVGIHLWSSIKKPKYLLAQSIKLAAKMHFKLLGNSSKSPETKHSSVNIDESLYFRVVAKGERVKIDTEHGHIFISYSKERLFKNINAWAATAVKAAWLSRNSLFRNRIPSKILLRIKYKNTHVGDLAASTALRLDPEAGGSIQRSRMTLFYTLTVAVAIRDYIDKYILPTIEFSYAVVPEPTYNDSIYKRAIHQLGGTVIESFHYSGKLQLVHACQRLKNPGIVEAHCKTELNDSDLAAVKAYLNARIQNLSPLWYMFNGFNRNDEIEIYDENSRSITFNSKSLYAVVFLHSFDDGQYYYGIDDFDDLYHWTTFTIDTLLANNSITTVLIKPHPNVNFERHKGDYHGNLRLHRQYRGCSRVKWLRSNTSVVALASVDNIIGITHHGSIAEELSFLRIPVIASVNAPWSSLYPFAKVWSTADEYKEIISTLSSKSIPTTDIDIFNEFVYENRISSTDIYTAAMRVRLARVLGIKGRSFPEITGMLSKTLNNISANSSEFLTLLDDMFQAASDSPFVGQSID